MVAEVLGQEPQAAVDPDLAVCLGAATQAGMLLEQVDARDGLVFTDISPMGIGIDVVTDIGDREVRVYKSLIKPNTQIPFSATYPFSLRTETQREVEIGVYQTHQEFDTFPLELGLAKQAIEEIGIIARITEIPPAQWGRPHPIEIDFSYDQNGLIQVHARIPGVQKSATVNFEHSRSRLSAREITDCQQHVYDLLQRSGLRAKLPPAPAPPDMQWMDHPDARWMDHPAARRLAPIIAQGEKLALERADLASSLTAAIAALKAALTAGDAEAITRSSDTLTDILFSTRNE